MGTYVRLNAEPRPTRTRPRVSVKQSGLSIELDYEFPGYELSDPFRLPVLDLEQEFRHINIAGAGRLVRGGWPKLPSFGRYLQIPAGHDFAFEMAPVGNPIAFGEPVAIVPAQTKLHDRKKRKTPIIEYDPDAYASELPYPDQPVRIRGPVEIDGYTALLVHVCPFRYVPADGTLSAFPRISLTIQLEQTKERQPAAERPQRADAYGNLFLNPGSMPSSSGQPKAGWPTLFERTGPVFLIIHSAAFATQAKRLAQWKEKCGLPTELVCIDDIGNTPAQIKAYLRQKRANASPLLSRLRYVMLFGDVPDIESWEVTWDAYMEKNRTDYYYATTKDAGAPSDLVFPWIRLGRVPVRTAAAADSFVAQIVRYERFPPQDPGYYGKVSLVAGDPGFFFSQCETVYNYIHIMERLRGRLESAGLETEQIYVSDKPGVQQCPEIKNFYGETVPHSVAEIIVDEQTGAAQAIDLLRQGRMLIAHRGHGEPPGWMSPKVLVPELNGLGTYAQSILFNVNCETGLFDQTDASESFAEAMLRIPGGAPSLIAACRSSDTELNDDLIFGLFDALWGGVIPTYPESATASFPVSGQRLGDILDYAKAYLPVVYDTPTPAQRGSIKDHLEIYHVIGDPTLEVRREKPIPVRLSITLHHEVPDYVKLRVTLSVCPVGSVVTIWLDDQLIKRVEPESTEFALGLADVGPLTPGLPPHVLLVCFKAPGYCYAERRLRLA